MGPPCRLEIPKSAATPQFKKTLKPDGRGMVPESGWSFIGLNKICHTRQLLSCAPCAILSLLRILKDSQGALKVTKGTKDYQKAQADRRAQPFSLIDGV
jgi:hypothetical protein